MIRILIILLALFFTNPAKAETRLSFNSSQIALLNEAQDYLAKVRTIKANFVQINPGSSVVSSGEIIIAKPGRLKMTYSEPYRIDYYINEDDLIQYDYDLDEVTRGEAPENPLKVLLYDGITLAKNDVMNVTNVTDEGQTFNVFLLNKTDDLREVSGLILKFRKFPMELISIGRVDNEGNNTQTNFSSVSINQDIDDSEFIFKKPKKSFPNSRR